MWVIGKVNKMQKEYLENLGNQVNSVEGYDVEQIVGANQVLRENEEMVVIWVEGDFVEDVKTLTELKEASKNNQKKQDLHQERLTILEEIWEGKCEHLRTADFDIISYRDWTCNGDTYSMEFEFCYNNDSWDTREGTGEVEFYEGVTTIKGEDWDADLDFYED